MNRTVIPSCFQCGKDLEPRLAPPQRMTMRYEGSPHEVLVDKLPEWHCADCQVSVIDESSDKPLQDALRKHIGLLRPEQIKAGLKALGISQEKFAERLGCAAESVSRWLNGAVLQSRARRRGSWCCERFRLAADASGSRNVGPCVPVRNCSACRGKVVFGGRC